MVEFAGAKSLDILMAHCMCLSMLFAYPSRTIQILLSTIQKASNSSSCTHVAFIPEENHQAQIGSMLRHTVLLPAVCIANDPCAPCLDSWTKTPEGRTSSSSLTSFKQKLRRSSCFHCYSSGCLSEPSASCFSQGSKSISGPDYESEPLRSWLTAPPLLNSYLERGWPFHFDLCYIYSLKGNIYGQLISLCSRVTPSPSILKNFHRLSWLQALFDSTSGHVTYHQGIINLEARLSHEVVIGFEGYLQLVSCWCYSGRNFLVPTPPSSDNCADFRYILHFHKVVSAARVRD